MAACSALLHSQPGLGRSLSRSADRKDRTYYWEGGQEKQSGTRRVPSHRAAGSPRYAGQPAGGACLLCRPRDRLVKNRHGRKKQLLLPGNAISPGALLASGCRRGQSPVRAWLDSVAVRQVGEGIGHVRTRDLLGDGSVDPQGNWQEGAEAEVTLRGQGEDAEPSSDELWLSLREAPGFSVEMLGGQRIVELVSAWDRLAPQLPPDVGKGAAAQMLLGALKLAVPALQGPCLTEGGRPRLLRALDIAKTLASLKMDAATLAAGVLVEAVAVGGVTLAAVETALGPAVGCLLLDSTRVRALPTRVDTYDDTTARALRQFCLAFHDVRAVVVELAARLETLRYSAWLPRYQQQLTALETLQIYAPMAHALGTGSLMWELEDAAFRVLYPSAYASCEAFLRQHWQQSPAVLEAACVDLDKALRGDVQMGQLAHDWAVSSRTKSLYSFMRKQLRDGRGHSEVYDLLGLRMIVKPHSGGGLAAEEARGAKACYRVREVARQLWEEHPKRYKDYIAAPKKNGYQSLHMLVQPSQRQGAPPVELQIRTERMDAQAVSGGASHGAYKGGLTDPQQVEQLRLIMEAAAELATASFADTAAGPTEVVAGEVPDHLFAMLDTNGDGRLSVEELQAAMVELGACGAGDAAELMALLDCNTDGGVSLQEFSLFRRRIAVLQRLPHQDAALHQQLHASWDEPLGEVAEASYTPLTEELDEEKGEAGLHDSEGATTEAAGGGDETRGLWEGEADIRGKAAEAENSGVDGRCGTEQDRGNGERLLTEQLGTSLGVSGSTSGDESVGGVGLEGTSLELVARLPQSSSRQSSTLQGGQALGARAGAARVAGLAIGGTTRRRAAVRAVGASASSGGGAVAVVARRTGSAEDLVAELRQRGARAAPTVVDEQEFVVEKGSDLDRRLSHYSASSAPTNGAIKQHPHSGTSANGIGDHALGGASNGGDHVLTRQELNRRLAGLDERPPENGQSLGGGAGGQSEEDRQRGLVRALRRVEGQLAGGKYEAARTLLNVLTERHSRDGRLWLQFGHLESQDPRGAGAPELYARAQACLEQEAAEVEQGGERETKHKQRIVADLAQVQAALARLPSRASLSESEVPPRGSVHPQLAPEQPKEAAGRKRQSRQRGPIAGKTPLHRVLGAAAERSPAPRSAAQVHQLAGRLAMQGNTGRARSLLLQGLQAAPHDVVLRLSLARLEADAGNANTARDHFQLAASAAPHNVLCWQTWAVFEAKLGDFHAARRLFSRGLALDPRDVRLLQTWARQEARRGCPDGKAKATELYQRCLEIDKKNAAAWQAWGLLEAETGNMVGARRLFEACLVECPQEPAPLVAYGRAERLYGALDAARALLKRATYLAPQYQPAWVELSLVEKQAGNHALAADLLERARTLPPPPRTRYVPGGQKLSEGENGKPRHRNLAHRKDADLQRRESADSDASRGNQVSFEASVQALRDSFKPTSYS